MEYLWNGLWQRQRHVGGNVLQLCGCSLLLWCLSARRYGVEARLGQRCVLHICISACLLVYTSMSAFAMPVGLRVCSAQLS